MPFACTALSVLFTGPGDTSELVAAGVAAVHDWNSSRAKNSEYVLIPKHYSTDSVSLFAQGKDGQSVINEQLVDDADIVISVFRHRFGTATPRAESGTAEEIDRSMKDGTRLHIYFVNADEDRPDLRDEEPRDQWDKLEKFRRGLKEGLWSQFDTPANFQDLVRRAIELDIAEFSRDRSSVHVNEPPHSDSPIDLRVDVGPSVGYFTDGDTAREGYIKSATDTAMGEFRAAQSEAVLPLSDNNQITELGLRTSLDEWAQAVRIKWESSLQYLAGWGWPTLTMELEQLADTYLTSVRIDLRFEGVIGVPPRVGRAFDLGTMIRPLPGHSPRMGAPRNVNPIDSLLDSGTFTNLHPKGYPVTWENDQNSLVVTVQLDKLPPKTPWKLNAPDVVLYLPETTEGESIAVTWAASAAGVSGLFEGSLQLPVRAETVTGTWNAAQGSQTS